MITNGIWQCLVENHCTKKKKSSGPNEEKKQKNDISGDFRDEP